MILSAVSESTAGVLNEAIVAGTGMIVLMAIAATAAVMFISSGRKTAPFAYLKKEKFETEYGVSNMVKERRAQYKDLYTRNNIAGTCLCVIALVTLFVGAIIGADNNLFVTFMLSLSFFIAGAGVISEKVMTGGMRTGKDSKNDGVFRGSSSDDVFLKAVAKSQK